MAEGEVVSCLRHISGEHRDIIYGIDCPCCGSMVGRIHERTYVGRDKRYQAEYRGRRHYFRKLAHALDWIEKQKEPTP
jgi:hypothetical protein